MKKALLLVALGTMLAGCAHHSQILHTASYYNTHKAALKKEIAFCKKTESLSNIEIENCSTAGRVRAGQDMGKGRLPSGEGLTNNPALLP